MKIPTKRKEHSCKCIELSLKGKEGIAYLVCSDDSPSCVETTSLVLTRSYEGVTTHPAFTTIVLQHLNNMNAS